MRAGVVLFEFLEWIYGEGIREFVRAWANLHWFFYHFFSVPELLRTIFQPLKRRRETYQKGFDPEKFFEAAAINTVMRVAGFFVRATLILLALVIEMAVFLLAAAALIIFLGFPLFAPLGILTGLFFVIN